MSTTVRAIVREWQRRHHLRIKPDVLGELTQRLNAEHGPAEAQPQAEGCAPTSDWGCEARRKLGIARGDLDTIANECEDLEAAQGVARNSLHVTAMPNLCRDSTRPEGIQEPALDRATIECLARDVKCPCHGGSTSRGGRSSHRYPSATHGKQRMKACPACAIPGTCLGSPGATGQLTDFDTWG